MDDKKIKEMVYTSLLAALICVATFIIKMPSPVTGGYTHLGDGFIFIAGIYRVMSKNILARQKENNKFLQYWNPSKKWLGAKYSTLKSSREYKYFKCPNCKQELRVPRGKGKISVTCNKCNNKFIQKS